MTKKKFKKVQNFSKVDLINVKNIKLAETKDYSALSWINPMDYSLPPKFGIKSKTFFN